MASEETTSNRFQGYNVNYIDSLLKIVKNDVQDNTIISDDGYLKVALDACIKFNEDFEDDTFDNGGETDD